VHCAHFLDQGQFEYDNGYEYAYAYGMRGRVVWKSAQVIYLHEVSSFPHPTTSILPIYRVGVVMG
jgi:hypothetical protein